MVVVIIKEEVKTYLLGWLEPVFKNFNDSLVSEDSLRIRQPKTKSKVCSFCHYKPYVYMQFYALIKER